MDWAFIITTIISIISSLVAIYKTKTASDTKKENNEVTKKYTKTEEQLKLTVDYYNPNAPLTKLPDGIPDNSFKMSEITKKLILSTIPESEHVYINGVISKYEQIGTKQYELVFSNGYYLIEYGLIKFFAVSQICKDDISKTENKEIDDEITDAELFT